ncbi:penicillin-binding protein 1A [Variovorax sp. JS1663]|uniref:penicillin-binding protein 1A n=1 Tax=Variovorax sp. JS1663 TaxID=1851577 RepID=UPI000B3456F2|nr:PBP1A family penicillin-binding protein [Variovorax sp. JS1663]OUM01485.1 penicillin-binding protein [Variovorax sp. JS1663]
MKRVLRWTIGIAAGGALASLCAVGIAIAVLHPRLPDVSSLDDYRPRQPLRIYTADDVLIGEFGEERRTYTPLDQIPQAMKNAVIAVEDARFYAHPGVDPIGLLRAVVANLRHGLHQGASTITMQVAREIYLSQERTLTRKLSEAMLAFELERRFGKDRILEIYLNQIFLGRRAFGFAAASETYFGKPLQQVTLAEAAMLAGLPKAPQANNPVVNPRRARARQLYVLDRMQEAGMITAEQAAAAKKEPLQLRAPSDPPRLHAEYVAETVRQMMVAQYGKEAYTRGFKVQTSLVAADQSAAWQALRKGLLDYERRQPWRGPERFVELPADGAALDDAVDEALAGHPDSDELLAAVVLEADAKTVTAVRADGEPLRITDAGLRLAQPGLAPRAAPNLRVRRGAVIRIAKTPQGAWEILQMPQAEGAFVALDPRDGAVKALVGGFDFGRNQFNHVTQAWRQPGSSFKPFIYSAALAKGFTPATLVDDAPLFYDSAATGSRPWEPKNFDGGFDGPMTLRRALELSKNMVTIRVLESIGPRYAQDWITRFGFERGRHPAYLPMALGAGAVTPMQMAGAYAVFANGGFRVSPRLVTRITDARGEVLVEAPPVALDESARVIPERNAFVMRSLLQSVVRHGSGVKAWQALRRDDLHGKTGTTNDSVDTWFAGFQPTQVGIAWIGYDTPRQLGVRGETGGSLSLPVWTGYMQAALRGVPVAPMTVPDSVVQVDGEWYYDDYAPGHGIASLGLDAKPAAPAETLAGAPVGAVPTDQERLRILDLFR